MKLRPRTPCSLSLLLLAIPFAGHADQLISAGSTINLPRRGPSPVLKPETRLTFELMDDLGIPDQDPMYARQQQDLIERAPQQQAYQPAPVQQAPAYQPPPPPQVVYQPYYPQPVIVCPPVVYAYPASPAYYRYGYGLRY